jgi:hypothetical protein
MDRWRSSLQPRRQAAAALCALAQRLLQHCGLRGHQAEGVARGVMPVYTSSG